ncbi:hypothetical protein PGT21_025493 [Puccinia graminis f. sp. tritici]|uniref:Uncharacterized protein n=1 Tax=Puccinia graminis f. sp. tritici TaxID=56615 RepID=A0A5B0NB27_PUCGR|nr:hypothetical protein PGT21_025493 [Puccinia graminis f. sp. tritici]KAA1113800.1 hypothetical protein PGTUg99_022096 [Puccinia graminis f. sp. tritici]
MVSRLKNLFAKSKSGEAKFSRRLDAIFCRGNRTSSSQSISSKNKELERTSSRATIDSKINVNNRRLQIRLSVTRTTRYSPVHCSPCSPPAEGTRLEQALPLLPTEIRKESETRRASDLPRSPSPIATSHESSSSESQSTDCHYFENVKSETSYGSSEILEAQEEAVRIKFRDAYFPAPSTTCTEKTNLKLSRNLMDALSSHQIEWAAMIELQKADHSGILRGLTSRQIRWLVREGRCKTWLVGTAGPLIEEEKDEVQDVQSIDSSDGANLTEPISEEAVVLCARKAISPMDQLPAVLGVRSTCTDSRM